MAALKTLGHAATDQRTRAALQWVTAAIGSVVAGMILLYFGDWKRNNDLIPLVVQDVSYLKTAVNVTLPASIAGARVDPFTGAQGREMEGRLGRRIDEVRADLNGQLDEVRKDVRELRRDVRAALPADQQWRFGRAFEAEENLGFVMRGTLPPPTGRFELR